MHTYAILHDLEKAVKHTNPDIEVCTDPGYVNHWVLLHRQGLRVALVLLARRCVSSCAVLEVASQKRGIVVAETHFHISRGF